MVEDRVADLILCLDSTLDTVATFEEMYEQFAGQQSMASSISGEPRESAYGIDIVIFGLRKRAREISYRQKQAKVLLKKVQTTRTLVRSCLIFASIGCNCPSNTLNRYPPFSNKRMASVPMNNSLPYASL